MQFVLHFDAVGALIFIMDYLKQKNTTLCALAARIPKFYIVRRDVGCPPSEKPKVLKHLVKNAGGREVDATDGVKIKDAHGWVMIIPDEAAPTCHVVAQSQSEEYAQELCLGLEQEILNLENPKQP